MNELARISLKFLDIIVMFVMTFGSPMSALAQDPPPTEVPTIVSDLADYPPGALVTLTGAGWTGDVTVNILVEDAIRRTWQHAQDVPVDADGNIQDVLVLRSFFISDFTVMATGVETGRLASASSTDSGGAYSINWSAADPELNKGPHGPTYNQVGPTALACPAPSGGTGRAAGPLANAIFGNPKDAVESLAPPMMSLGQIVPFEALISVPGSTSPENAVIAFTPYWLNKTASGGGFGYDPAYKVYCAFVDSADSATVDPCANAKVHSWIDTVLNTGTGNEQIQGTIQVSGLDNGDKVVLKLWVVLKSSIPAGTSGDVQNGLVSAATAVGETINTDHQTVPLLRVQEFSSSVADVSIAKSESPDPVVQGKQLTYTVVVKNNATAVAANGIIVTDILDASTTFVSGSWPGGTCSPARLAATPPLRRLRATTRSRSSPDSPAS